MEELFIDYEAAEKMEMVIKNAIKSNTLRLLRYHNLSATKFREHVGISKSNYSKMFGGSSDSYAPTFKLKTLTAICTLFDVSLYDLCCTEIHPEDTDEELPLPIDTRTTRPDKEYGLFLGTYEGLYFDTSMPIGEDDRPTPSSFSHVILTIYKSTPTAHTFQASNRTIYKVVAIFNCPSDMVQRGVSVDLDNTATGDRIETYYTRLSAEYPHIYWGELTLTDQFAYIDVRQTKSRDIVHIILHNKAAVASPRKKTYIGGLGIMASSARGAERMPCVQQILLSRQSLSAVSDEELAELLYLSMPKLSLHNSARDLISWVKGLYLPDDEQSPFHQLSDEQKTAAVEVQLDRMIMEQMRRNAFRYRKISFSQDSELYRRLKPLQKKAE